MKIIAFGHRRFVGKDTAANLLATYLRSNKKNISIKKLGFASKLKEIAHGLYGHYGLMDEDYYENHLEMKEVILPGIGKSPRTIWIELGNKLREIHDDTWLAYLFKGLKVDYLIIKDLRYPNEAQCVQDAKGFNIRVLNPRIKEHSDKADTALKDWTNWTADLMNDGDMKQLNERVISLAHKLKL